MARLKDRYRDDIAPALQQELGVRNAIAVPRLSKVVVSMGIGRAVQEKRRLEAAGSELALITGQKPLICKARKSVSNFKLREGNPIGLKVTLRRERMYEFLDRLINLAIPRVRDFRGLNPTGFDGRGNYSMGLAEQTVFPEVDPDKVEFQQGMHVTVVTTARNDSDALRLLTLLGFPFRTAETAVQA